MSLASNNAHFMKVCALKSMGIIQVHDYMVEQELKEGSLVEILAAYTMRATDLFVYYQKHRYVQPKIKQFIKLLFPT